MVDSSNADMSMIEPNSGTSSRAAPTKRGKGRRRGWLPVVVMLVLVAGGAITFPTWRPYVAYWWESMTEPPATPAVAQRARSLARAAEGSWANISAALPPEQIPDGIQRAIESILAGDQHLSAREFGEAEAAYREGRKLYEFYVADAMNWFREEPSRVAADAAGLEEKLDELEQNLYARLAEASRLAEARRQNVIAARSPDRRAEAARRYQEAVDKQQLLSALQTLTGTHVFGQVARDDIAQQVRAGDLALEASRHDAALRAYALAKQRLERLLAWPSQAEVALRQRATLAHDLDRIRDTLGPLATDLPDLAALLDTASEHFAAMNKALQAGRLEDVADLIASTHSALSDAADLAASGLLVRARRALDNGKRVEAVRALNELAALVPDHQEGDRLLRDILAHRHTNSIGMTLAFIPPGSFTMGSPADERGRDADERLMPVTLDAGFLMGTTEVTQAQWQAVMGRQSEYADW